MRGMPNGVGRGLGCAKSDVVGSTLTRSAGFSASAGEAIAMAVEILWAMTQPTIFSRAVLADVIGTRKMYAFEDRRTSRERGGDDSARLTVSSRVES